MTVGLAVLAIGRLWYSLPTAFLVGGLAVWVVLCALVGKIILNKRHRDESITDDNLPGDNLNLEAVVATLIEEIASLRQSIDGIRDEIRVYIEEQVNNTEIATTKSFMMNIIILKILTSHTIRP
ncbi:hypothetical protein E6W36_07085 [Hankyongella ginsenosidimutans]|uniref:Uncharacterized protein n=1 Tax=Hankyongella ginsenosidimutans TaxID=1763828 RepID=A0A4D7C987_9SPHN|nr:hypothetical protein [Hankyongella ginsenosidimutans]QCI79397.1 hypothetical protein E6W36_07085 [Hankyongella ginsenosidimutans]